MKVSNTDSSVSMKIKKNSVCEGLKKVKGESDREMQGFFYEMVEQSSVKCKGV